MKRIILVFAITCSFYKTSLAQKFPDLSKPPATAEVFAPGIISSGFSERDFCLSPDGKLILYTIQSQGGVFQTIVVREKDKKGVRSKPERIPFAGNKSDLEPAFSHDGKWLFFASNRTIGDEKRADFDIWMVERLQNGWGEPIRLDSSINTTEDEFYPSIAKNGNLYFTAAYKNGPGKEDIWVSKWINGRFQKAIALDSAVNSKTYEFNAFVNPEETTLIFTSYGRQDDAGRGDLYVSKKDENGNWKLAENLKTLNTKWLDYCPFISPDGKILFFTSERNRLSELTSQQKKSFDEIMEIISKPKNGLGDIYWVKWE